jgi:hypothetical protein
MTGVMVDLRLPDLLIEMRKRHDFLALVAQELFANDILDQREVYLNDEDLARAVEAYYLLSEAYKRDKLGHTPDTPHLTEGPKKGALTTIAVMSFRPVRFVNPRQKIVSSFSVIANQLLALIASGSLIERDFEFLQWEQQRRFFSLLNHIGLKAKYKLRPRALHEYARDQSIGRHPQVYTIDVDRDEVLIDAMILLFESPLRP